jgi:glucosyl-3-phosphoglycerate phosphatase
VVTLILWRHGQTTFNAERRFQGQLDIQLNEKGRTQAANAARYLAALSPTAIFASDLSRATETAGALARLTGLTVQLDKDLRERSGGEWEGKTDAEIRENYPAEFAVWEPPGGETASFVRDRSEAALLRIADGAASGSVIVVTGHGASLGMGLSRVLGVPDGSRLLGPFGNCRWSVLTRRDGTWRLLEHNAGRLPEPVPDAGASAAEEVAPEVAPDGA